MSELAKTQTLDVFLNSLENDFLEVAPTKEMDFNREVHFAMQLLSANDYLLAAARKNKQSLRNAIINLSATNLTLNPIKKLAYLIPRKGQVCLDISYLGMQKAVMDTGSITYIHCEIVRQNDNFRVNGIGEKPEHSYSPFSERGDIVGCFVAAKTIEGEWAVTIMDIKEIYSIRDKSEAYKRGYGPWKDFETEMIKKTVIKRAYKSWGQTEKFHILEKTIEVANQQEGIDFKRDIYKELQEATEEDFPRNPDDMVNGPNYLIIKGKYNGHRLQDVDLEDLEDWMKYITTQQEKGRFRNKDWIETVEKVTDYIENYETYQDIINED